MSVTTIYNCDRCGEEMPKQWAAKLLFFPQWTGMKLKSRPEIDFDAELCQSCESLIVLKLSELKKEFTQKRKSS
jgi:DNA-directed RNA polymerase subunit RPC12/RpoP